MGKAKSYLVRMCTRFEEVRKMEYSFFWSLLLVLKLWRLKIERNYVTRLSHEMMVIKCKSESNNDSINEGCIVFISRFRNGKAIMNRRALNVEIILHQLTYVFSSEGERICRYNGGQRSSTSGFRNIFRIRFFLLLLINQSRPIHVFLVSYEAIQRKEYRLMFRLKESDHLLLRHCVIWAWNVMW